VNNVTVIRLWPPSAECVLCEEETDVGFGLACYEDYLVPDDYEGEWGGFDACQRCYRAWVDGTLRPWMTFHQARVALGLEAA